MRHHTAQSGFTLFIAMLVGGLSLAIGIAIYDIAVRELDLSVTATQSQYAIYAADTGAECALFYDFQYNGTGSAFATSSASVAPDPTLVKCNTQEIVTGPPAWTIAATPVAATTTFQLTLGPTNRYCTKVDVAKYVDSTGAQKTTVTARGYNTSCSGAAGITRLERALEVRY